MRVLDQVASSSNLTQYLRYAERTYPENFTLSAEAVRSSHLNPSPTAHFEPVTYSPITNF
jgi:hypothetical protein